MKRSPNSLIGSALAAFGCTCLHAPSAADAAGFGGPASAERQIESDAQSRTAGEDLFAHLRQRVSLPESVTLGFDYAAFGQGATGGPGAAAGAARLYGSWAPFDGGALVVKGENRQAYGGAIAPQALASEIGAAGLTSVTFSDAGWLLTNLYWRQSLAEDRAAFVAGIVDVADYLGVYAFANPWTDFSNVAFATDPTIPAPNQGVGGAVRVLATDNLYALAGVADPGGDPGDPFAAPFDDGAAFVHGELGWVSSFENRFRDNVHFTFWHVGARDGVEDGWGATISVSWAVTDVVTPFVRAGWSDGGGALYDRSISFGTGIDLGETVELVGVGGQWGRAPENGARGPADQFLIEMFLRVRLTAAVTATPDLQIIIDAADAPDDSAVFVGCLRLRAAF